MSDLPLDPPLDPPPFGTANVRKCIKANVRIQNHDRMQEVLILTSVCSSIASQLNGSSLQSSLNSSSNQDLRDSMNSELSSFSESMSEDGDEDEEDEEEEDDEDDDDEDESDSDESLDSCDENDGDCNGGRPIGTNNSFRMKAFWLRKEPICENHHGIWTTYIYYAKVLHKADLYWVITNEEVAIKAVSWRCIRSSQNRLCEDFLKEIAALQYLSDWHQAELPGYTIRDTHVMTADTVMSNETHLYIVMPYCRGGDLCQQVAERDKFSEDVAKFWFRQILKGVETLQMARVCHKDLSPENFILLDDKYLVIDFGMCLRIPYSNAGRHLTTPQIPCGKLPHMAPEIFLKQPFDGHSVDIWAVGTILLFMLTGKRLTNPPLEDRVFDRVDLGLSFEATDLLRKIFRLHPKDRLTLEQIKCHPFVL